MPLFRQRFTLPTVITVLAVAIAGCGETKVAQCNKLIEVANKAVSDVQAITTTAKPEDISAMSRIADTADAATKSMQELDLNDTTLQGYQQQFVSMYTDTSRATRELVAAVEAKDNQAAETAYQALQTATDQEGPLVNQVNTYCTGSAQPGSVPPETAAPTEVAPPGTGAPPEGTVAPEGTAPPEGTAAPEGTETPEGTAAPEGTETPESSPSP